MDPHSAYFYGAPGAFPPHAGYPQQMDMSGGRSYADAVGRAAGVYGGSSYAHAQPVQPAAEPTSSSRHLPGTPMCTYFLQVNPLSAQSRAPGNVKLLVFYREGATAAQLADSGTPSVQANSNSWLRRSHHGHTTSIIPLHPLTIGKTEQRVEVAAVEKWSGRCTRDLVPANKPHQPV